MRLEAPARAAPPCIDVGLTKRPHLPLNTRIYIRASAWPLISFSMRSMLDLRRYAPGRSGRVHADETRYAARRRVPAPRPCNAALSASIYS